VLRWAGETDVTSRPCDGTWASGFRGSSWHPIVVCTWRRYPRVQVAWRRVFRPDDIRSDASSGSSQGRRESVVSRVSQSIPRGPNRVPVSRTSSKGSCSASAPTGSSTGPRRSALVLWVAANAPFSSIQPLFRAGGSHRGTRCPTAADGRRMRRPDLRRQQVHGRVNPYVDSLRGGIQQLMGISHTAWSRGPAR
jgi:hypothetical protein